MDVDLLACKMTGSLGRNHIARERVKIIIIYVSRISCAAAFQV